MDPSLITDGPGTLRCADAPGTPCNPNVAPCLFNVVTDPCERNDVAADYPQVVVLMMDKVRVYNSSPLPIVHRCVRRKSRGTISQWSLCSMGRLMLSCTYPTKFSLINCSHALSKFGSWKTASLPGKFQLTFTRIKFDSPSHRKNIKNYLRKQINTFVVGQKRSTNHST